MDSMPFHPACVYSTLLRGKSQEQKFFQNGREIRERHGKKKENGTGKNSGRRGFIEGNP
jgi:hypothetical protein